MQMLDLVIGVFQLGLALVVLRQLGRFGRAFPWLVALMVFALARGAARIYEGVSSGGSSTATSLITDCLIVVALALLIAGLRTTIHGLSVAADEASGRTAEYERALRDYRAVLRHRIANRVAAIHGSAETLTHRADLPAEQREALLRVIEEESRQLEMEALDDRLYEVERLRPEEQELQPRPSGAYSTEPAH